jgi:hypothetical protein
MKIRAHETFSIRKGWIHKGVKNILLNPRLFTDKSINPCDVLGIGTNMVKSLRYWMTAVGIMEEVSEGNQKIQKLTRLGEIIDKYDKYYEEDGTNWFLHYMLAKNKDFATAWYWFFNIFKINSFDKQLFVKELSEFLHTRYGYDGSEKMLGDEFDCLIKTYCSKGKDVSPEDMNECPLVDLHLIEVSDNKDYKKRTPDKDAIHPLIVLAVISEQAKIIGSTEILINDLLNKECNIGKVFNLDRVNCFFYLEQLQKCDYLEVVRTAGLDVIKLKQQYDFFEIVELYYRVINGVMINE